MKLLSTLLPICLSPFLFACVIAIGNSSCSDTIVGSGMQGSEVRDVPSFAGVSASGMTHVVASTGDETLVVVSCDDNLLEYVRTEVRGDSLHVSMKSGSYQFEVPLEVTVVSPELESATVSGASDIQMTGVDTDNFEANTSGAGSLSVSGRADSVDVQTSGAGSMDLSQLTARTADVHVSGAGSVKINARESLDAQVSGAGKVRFAGSPTVSADVSGAGSVRRE